MNLNRQLIADMENTLDKILLKACIDSPQDMIILAIDRQFNYLAFNTFHERIMKIAYGIDIKPGMNILECMTSEDDVSKAKLNYGKALTGQSHITVEEYGELKRNYYETRYNPIFNEKQEIVGATAFAFDVSEKINTLESLKKSEDKFRRAFYTSPDSININRLSDGMYVSINDGFTKITGYTAEETIGKTSMELDIWAVPSDRNKLVQGLKEKGRYENLETQFRMKDGKLLTGIMSASVIEIDGVTHILSITRDISDRKRAEIALIESETRYRELVELAVDGILLGSHDGRIIEANSYILVLTGRKRDELIGTHISDLFIPEDLVKSPLRFDLLQKGETVINERRLLRKDGSTIPVEMHTKMMPDGTYQSIYQDISERRKSEERLVKLNECFLSFVSDPLVNINHLVAICGELVGATCSLYNRLEGNMLCSLGQWNAPSDYISVDNPEGHICNDVIKSSSEKTVIIRNLQETSYATTDPNVLKYNLHTYVGKSIKFENENVGSLCLVFQKDFNPDQNEIRFLEIIASAIGIEEERRQGDLALRSSETKLQSIIHVAPVGIGLVVNRVLMEVNDTLCKLIGYEREELIGKLSEILYPAREEYERVGKEKYDQIASKGTGSVETVFKCRDGRLLNVILSSTPLDRSDHSKGVTFTVLDITERKKVEVALRESEEKFRSIAENLSDIIFLTDTKGTLAYVSPSVEVLGYSADEFPGKFFGDFLVEGELEKGMSFFTNALNSINLTTTVQLLFKRKDGSSFFAELSGSVFYAGNEVRGVLGLLRDISEKVKRENDLRKLSRAVEQNPVSIVITDTNGIIEYANQKMCEVTGYSIDELIGKNPSVLSSKRKSQEEYRELWDTIKRGDDWKGEFLNKRKNGELYWESALISPIKNEKEEVTHFLGIKEDISLRKALEASTRESEKRYRELFLNNPIPTYIFDESTLEFVEVNEAAIESYGYSKEEFSSMTLRDLRIMEEIPELLDSLKNIGHKTFYSTSMRHVKKDGTVFPVEITSHSLPEKNGRRTRLVTVTDITERLKAAQQMTLAKEKAEASDRIKTTFLNNISHEVRTPLNGILGFAEIMNQTGLSDEEKKESMSMLHQSSERLLNTITSYMDISLLTSGAMSVNLKEISPVQLLSSLYKLHQPLCSQKKLQLFLDIPSGGETLSVNSDPEVLRKIFSHLLDNAIKFTEKGNIHFGFTNTISEIIFYVSDTGIGIQKESLGHIFDKFSKEDRGPQRISEGSGLGLSIARGLTEILGGRISVESEPGTGSCFSLTFPSNSGNSTTSGSTSRKHTHKKSGNDTILIAEDDDTNFFYLNAIISREFGSKILHAENGREAIDLFSSNPDIRLVLMDIKMPEVDGIEATRQIKTIRSEVPVIAITAYAMSGDEERVLAAGCDGYLSKPISKEKLLRKIAEFVKI
ncbi:MAG: PAS domain S-box protein [Bacteroidales bacterium]|nr:PAS domain S-box protein [Bacteroidales bacterium]